MKRETIERHLHYNANATSHGETVAETIVGLLDRERERLTEELDEIKAKATVEKVERIFGDFIHESQETPGCTDIDGHFWEFVETSRGWIAVLIPSSAATFAISEREHFTPNLHVEAGVSNALRTWLKETGRA